MAKKKIEGEEEVVDETAEAEVRVAPEAPLEETVIDAPSGDREARWKAFLAKAKELNPVKFSLKEKNGEFRVIPDSFR